MDIQRILLIGGLAFFGYMMVIQWHQDYRQPDQPVPVTSVSSQASSPEITATPSLENPAIDDEIPTASNDVNEPTTSAKLTPAPAAATSQLIRVKTDVLNVLIDPYGGDIIHAELNDYLAQLGSEQKFVLLEQTDNRVYIAQSGLTGKNGPDASGKRPRYKTDNVEYQMNDGEDQLIIDLNFADTNGVKITKRFTFTRGKYLLSVDYLVNNTTTQPWQANMFGQIKRDRSEDPSSQSSMGMQSFLGLAFSSTQETYTKIKFDDVDEGKYADKTQGGWVAMLQHYFVSAWIPNPEKSHSYFTREKNGNYFGGFVSPSLSLAPGQQGSVGAQFFVGPKIQEKLVSASPNLELTVDFGVLWFIAKPLFELLALIQSFVINWGIAIILVTACVKTLFFWPSAIAYRSMAKMRTLGPELQRMKELYGDDRQKMSQSMMALYKKEKINPLGGCLPMLIQMPVFISLYWVLLESVELRHAPFMLWIQDMSVMDPFFILPLMMGASMFIQQMLNPTPPDPMQAKVMKMLPFIFTIFFLWFPAGLVLYWVVNNILSICQQWVITRNIEAQAAAASANK